MNVTAGGNVVVVFLQLRVLSYAAEFLLFLPLDEGVGNAIYAGRGQYDAILLDVDNGPDGLTRPANDGLYSARGLDEARLALRPGGVLAIWSAAPDPVFTRRLGRAGFAVDEVKVRARENGKGATHTIWFATAR